MMVKVLPVLLIAGVLAGCAGTPASEDKQDDSPAAPVQLSCYQARWQAETIQVVDKRGGQAFWDRYDFMPQIGNVGCR